MQIVMMTFGRDVIDDDDHDDMNDLSVGNM